MESRDPMLPRAGDGRVPSAPVTLEAVRLPPLGDGRRPEGFSTNYSQQDESVRDLKRHLAAVSGTDPLVVNRTGSLPVMGTEGIITVSDVAVPGGFRRLHLANSGQAAVVPPLVTQLTLRQQLFDPRYLYPNFKDDDDDEPTTINAEQTGDAPTSLTVLVLLKTFLTGTILVLPNGFSTAGLFGGMLVLAIVGFVEVYCMLILVACRAKEGSGSYSTLAFNLGKYGPTTVSVLLVASQYGFVCAEQLYVAENALKFLQPMYPDLQEWHLLFFFQIFLVPMSWVRKLKFFAITNLAGDVIIIGCVLYLFAFGMSQLAEDGISPTVALVKPPDGVLMFFGTCVYVYEGINTVLPIYEAHAKKESFNLLFGTVLSSLTAVFLVFGGIWYCAFGAKVANVATLNLPEGSLESKIVPPLYALGCLFTCPVLVFPIVQELEPVLFPRDRWWSSAPRKWAKNCFRTLIMLLSAVIASLGGTNLQKFLAIIGGLCCGPLAIMLPAALHIRICDPKPVVKGLDGCLVLFGAFVTVVSTSIAIAEW